MAHFIPSQKEYPFFALLLSSVKKNKNLFNSENRRNFIFTWELHSTIKTELQQAPNVRLDKLKSVASQKIDEINSNFKNQFQFSPSSIQQALEEAHQNGILVPDLK
jgi:hypothetical protein